MKRMRKLRIPIMICAAIIVFFAAYFAAQMIPHSGADENYLPITDETDRLTETDTKQGTRTVACIGDSITYGMGSGDVVAGSYVAHLKTMIPHGCTILNFGHPGAAVMSDVSPHTCYTDSNEYRQSLESDADIVIIMLGTNDAWYIDSNNSVQFKDKLFELVKKYIGLQSGPTVFLCTPPCRFDDPTCEDATEQYIIPAVRDVAAELDVSLIDVYSVTVGRDGLYYDGIHLSSDGYEFIAEMIYTYISPLF